MASFQARLIHWILRSGLFGGIDFQAEPAALRAKMNRMSAKTGAPAAGVRAEKVNAGGVPAEWLLPEGNSQGALLYLHGGGYIVGSIDTHRSLASRIAKESGLRTLIIDYRLAPEHPYPAGLDDAATAYRWLVASGIAPEEITISGDSAGGGMALALLMKLRAEGDKLPAAAALLSPWSDLTMSGHSHYTHTKRDPMLTMSALLAMARHYLQSTSPAEPLVSPLYGDFAGLPPLLIHVGENEILLDDASRVAAKAKAAGVAVEYKSWPGVMHVFQAVPQIPEGRAAVSEIATFLSGRVAKDAGAKRDAA